MDSADVTRPGDAPLTPGEEVCLLVAGSAALLYWAEKDENPAVKDYWDALHYVTTSLSVGYANLFPVTPIGKLLASTLMTVGPALSARVLDTGAPGSDVGDKLDEVVAQLKQLNARLAPG
jgi:voltage-gated potassium channel